MTATPKLHLGKKAPTYDKRDLQFATYRTTAPLPPHPRNFGHEKLFGSREWLMLGNGPDDSVAPGFSGAGDCVFAGADHETMMWTAEVGPPAIFSGSCAISDYSAVTGYKIGDPSTDQGTVVRDALKFRRGTGVIDAGKKRHKIGAYLGVEPGNLDSLQEALYLFGVVGLGIQFPASAMDQFNAGKPWSVQAGSPIEGGHYIPLVARRGHYYEVVTWGRVQKVTASFLTKYCDEAWAILSPEMLKDGKSPEGFDLAQLTKDLKAL